MVIYPLPNTLNKNEAGHGHSHLYPTKEAQNQRLVSDTKSTESSING